MKLSQRALEEIRSNNQVKGRLMTDFDKSSFTIDRWIDANEKNGPLTTVRAVQLIKEGTQLSEHEILENEKENAA